MHFQLILLSVFTFMYNAGRMEYLIADKWKDYELIDMGDGEKLERWGNVILQRPDPQVIWPKSKPELWGKADAVYHRSSHGGGNWEKVKKLPDKWTVAYGPLKFSVKTMSFKHTGLFPEQAVNWDYMMEAIKKAGRPIKVLNLFAYTGGATIACAAAGAEVTHVDSAKGMVYYASENAELSGLKNRKTRWIVDDAIKFIDREIRRENTYDGIIMDPPAYGKGPKGETWRCEDDLYGFIEKCSRLLSKNPLFFIVNSYTAGFSPMAIKNMVESTVGKKYKGSIRFGEIGLKASSSGMVLPCGVFARFEGK